MDFPTRSIPHTNRQQLADIRQKLIVADSILDHGLKAIHSGRRLDAMEAVYTASCLIEEIVAALEVAAAAVEIRTLC